MGVYIVDNKLVIITVPRSICINLTNKDRNSLKHEIDHIIKRNGYVAKRRIKKEIEGLLSKYKHVNDIYEYQKQYN